MYALGDTRGLILTARPIAHPRVVRSRIVVPRRWGVRGLGQSTTSTITSAVGAGSSAVLSTLVAAGAVAGPLGAAIGGAIGGVLTLINTLFQPNYNKIAATNDVNEVEPYLQENLANWLSLSPAQKTVSVQQAAIITAQGWIAKMQQLCQQVPGSAGQNCISQRVPGGCGFHVAQPYGWINGSFVPSGPNDPNGSYCWDWGYYVDSISQDPNVIPDPGLTSTQVAASGTQTGSVIVGGVPVASTSASGPVAAPASFSLASVPWYVWAGAAALGLYAVAA